MTDKKLDIFQIGPDDWQIYKKIRLELLQSEANAFHDKYEDWEKLTPQEWRQKLSKPTDIFFLAKHNNDIVGTIYLSLEEEDLPKDVAVVHGTFVKSQYRHQGFGYQLLNHLISELVNYPHIKYLRLWVKKAQSSAISLYEKAGFKFFAVAGERTIIMQKTL